MTIVVGVLRIRLRRRRCHHPVDVRFFPWCRVCGKKQDGLDR